MTRQRIYGIIGGNALSTQFGFDEKCGSFSKFKEMISGLIASLEGKVMTSLNPVCELVCGELAIEYEKPLLCVMPFEEQASKWSDCLRERFFSLHEKSESVKLLSRKFYEGCEKDALDYICKTADHIIFIKSGNEVATDFISEEVSFSKPLTVINLEDYTITYACPKNI